MALVLKNEMVADFLANKMAVKDGVTTTVAVNGVTYMEIVTYPSQEGFTDGAILALIKKPFIDFAVSCGDAGAMTAERITAKYAEVPAALAESIATDFAKAFGNYKIIPETATLAITAAPIGSIFDIMIPEEPANAEAVDEVK